MADGYFVPARRSSASAWSGYFRLPAIRLPADPAGDGACNGGGSQDAATSGRPNAYIRRRKLGYLDARHGRSRSRRKVGDAAQPLHRPWQRGGRAACWAHWGRRRCADDPDADLAVRHQAILRDLQRPGRRRPNAARGRGRAPVQGHGEPAPGGLDGGRLGADGVLRRVPAAPARQQRGRGTEGRDHPRRGAAGRRRRHGAPLRPGPQVRPAADRQDPACAGPPGADRPDRHDRRADRGPDLGGLPAR